MEITLVFKTGVPPTNGTYLVIYKGYIAEMYYFADRGFYWDTYQDHIDPKEVPFWTESKFYEDAFI